MRITIFGAGALGSLVGALLSKRHEVHLVARLGHVQAIQERGLWIEGVVKDVFSLEAHPNLEDAPPPDIILVTVKAYDTEAALEALATIGRNARTVVSLQNGLTNLRLFQSAFPDRSVIGTTSMGATLIGPGHVLYAGKGDTAFGQLTNDPERAAEMAGLFNEAGLNAREEANIEAELWMKGIINASINPLTAILECLNGELIEDEEVLRVSRLACQEAVAVAEGIGVRLPAKNPFAKVKEVMRATAKNRSSMLQDLEHGKRTEIDQITGEIVRRAEAAGVSVPVNRALWTMVRRLEQRPL